jgi:hypothetical protein
VFIFSPEIKFAYNTYPVAVAHAIKQGKKVSSLPNYQVTVQNKSYTPLRDILSIVGTVAE